MTAQTDELELEETAWHEFLEALNKKEMTQDEEDFAAWDASAHPRGKTTDASRGGSFAPKKQLPADEVAYQTNLKLLNDFSDKYGITVSGFSVAELRFVDTKLLQKTLEEVGRNVEEFPVAAKFLKTLRFTDLGNNWGMADFAGGTIDLHKLLYTGELLGSKGLLPLGGGRFHDGMSNAASNVRHEFGHFVDFWLRAAGDHQLIPYARASGFGVLNETHTMWMEARGWALGAQFRQPRLVAGDAEPITGYATTNSKEWFAETFAALKYGDARAKAHPDAKALRAYLKEVKKAKRTDTLHTTDEIRGTPAARENFEQAQALAKQIGIPEDKI